MESSGIFTSSSRWVLYTFFFIFFSPPHHSLVKSDFMVRWWAFLKFLFISFIQISTTPWNLVNVCSYSHVMLPWVQEVKGFREEIGESLNRIENRVVTISERDKATRTENGEHLNGIRRLGKESWNSCVNSFWFLNWFNSLCVHCAEEEIEKLKYQTSDDMNDVVKYISTINDKINQLAVMRENQHNFAE